MFLKVKIVHIFVFIEILYLIHIYASLSINITIYVTRAPPSLATSSRLSMLCDSKIVSKASSKTTQNKILIIECTSIINELYPINSLRRVKLHMCRSVKKQAMSSSPASCGSQSHEVHCYFLQSNILFDSTKTSADVDKQYRVTLQRL